MCTVLEVSFSEGTPYCVTGMPLGNSLQQSAPNGSDQAAQQDTISFYQSEMASMLPPHSIQTAAHCPDRTYSGVGHISRDLQLHKSWPRPSVQAPR